MLFNFPAFMKSLLFYFPSPGNLSDPGIEPRSPAMQVDVKLGIVVKPGA